MKEDSHLICPIAFDDPHGLWKLKIGKSINSHLPLVDMNIKVSPNTSVQLSKLPLRFMPSSSSLFKDTNHPFRWFLAPFAHIYFLKADTLEDYKSSRPALRQWVDGYSGLKRSYWIIIYVPGTGTTTLEASTKIYNKLSQEFFVEQPGDRSLCLQSHNDFANDSTTASDSVPKLHLHQEHRSFQDLFSKVKEGVLQSFQRRTSLYEIEIKRLESHINTSKFDFRQLYLVKESLALLYQMMHLSEQALQQYDDLSGVLKLYPAKAPYEFDWPFTPVELAGSSNGGGASSSTLDGRQLRKSQAGTSSEFSTQSENMTRLIDNNDGGILEDTRNSFSYRNVDTSMLSMSPATHSDMFSAHNLSSPVAATTSTVDLNVTSPLPTSTNAVVRPMNIWKEASQQGNDLLSYSINTVRMRVLKNRIGVLELQKYLFSRQMYFLLLSNKISAYVEKGCVFVKQLNRQLLENIDSMPVSSFHDADIWIQIKRKQCIVWTVSAGMRLMKSYSLLSSLSLSSTANTVAADNTHSLLVSTNSFRLMRNIRNDGLSPRPASLFSDDSTIKSQGSLSVIDAAAVVSEADHSTVNISSSDLGANIIDLHFSIDRSDADIRKRQMQQQQQQQQQSQQRQSLSGSASGSWSSSNENNSILNATLQNSMNEDYHKSSKIDLHCTQELCSFSLFILDQFGKFSLPISVDTTPPSIKFEKVKHKYIHSDVSRFYSRLDTQLLHSSDKYVHSELMARLLADALVGWFKTRESFDTFRKEFSSSISLYKDFVAKMIASSSVSQSHSQAAAGVVSPVSPRLKSKHGFEIYSIANLIKFNLSEILSAHAKKLAVTAAALFPQLSSITLPSLNDILGMKQSIGLSSQQQSQLLNQSSEDLTRVRSKDFTAEALFFELSFLVMLSRLTVSHHRQAQRHRISLYTNSLCADAMFCAGELSCALELYEDCLSLLQAAASHKNQYECNVTLAPADRSAFCSYKSFAENTGSVELSYWLLRKSLVCAQLTSASFKYCCIALQLLDTHHRNKFNQSFSDAPLHESIMSDLVKIATSREFTRDWDHYVQANMLLYFSYSIDFAAETTISVGNVNGISQSLVDVPGGDICNFRLKVESIIPESVGTFSLDLVEVVFSEIMGDKLEEKNKLEFTYSQVLGLENDIKLGINIAFHPPTLGYYKIASLLLYMGQVKFIHQLSSSTDRVFAFRVACPQDVINMSLEAPIYSPFHSVERIRLCVSPSHAGDSILSTTVICAADADTLSDISASVFDVPYHSPSNSGSDGPDDYHLFLNYENNHSKFNIGTCHWLSHSLPTETNVQGRKSIDFITASQTPDGSSSYQSTEMNTTFNVVYIPFVAKLVAESQHSIANEQTDDNGNKDDLIQLQFSLSKVHCFKSGVDAITKNVAPYIDGSYRPTVHLSVICKVLRNECVLEYSRLLPLQLSIGKAVLVENHSLSLHNNEFFEHFVFRNISPVPIDVVGYNMKSANWKCLLLDDFKTNMKSFKEINCFVVVHSPSNLTYIGQKVKTTEGDDGNSLNIATTIPPRESTNCCYHFFIKARETFLRSNFNEITFRIYAQRIGRMYVTDMVDILQRLARVTFGGVENLVDSSSLPHLSESEKKHIVSIPQPSIDLFAISSIVTIPSAKLSNLEYLFELRIIEGRNSSLQESRLGSIKCLTFQLDVILLERYLGENETRDFKSFSIAVTSSSDDNWSSCGIVKQQFQIVLKKSGQQQPLSKHTSIISFDLNYVYAPLFKKNLFANKEHIPTITVEYLTTDNILQYQVLESLN